MTSAQYTELARAILWVKDWPQDMSGMTIRVIDFTGEKTFLRLAGGMGYATLTDWRRVYDRVRKAICRRGGRVRLVRVNVLDYEAWRRRHGMVDNRRVRECWLRNLEVIKSRSGI